MSYPFVLETGFSCLRTPELKMRNFDAFSLFSLVWLNLLITKYWICLDIIDHVGH